MQRTRTVTWPVAIMLLIVLSLAALAAACGSDSAAAPAANDEAAPAANDEAAPAANDEAATVDDHQEDAADHEEDASGQAMVMDDHEDGDANLEDAVERTISVTASEFAFESNEIHVKAGETVRLQLHNAGLVLHDITARQFVGDAESVGAEHGHESTMADMDEMAFHASAEAGEEGALIFRATEPGEYQLFCSVPGHEQLGMTATLVVEP